MSTLGHRIGTALFKTWDDRDAAQRIQAQARTDRINSHTHHPIVHAVLCHHGPVFEPGTGSPVCRGCDTADDPESAAPEWPCSTWLLVEKQLPSVIMTKGPAGGTTRPQN